MTEFKIINVDDLVINHENDRHGRVASEKEAIEWLLTNKLDHMKNLLKDIIAEGRILNPPLVQKIKGKNKYLVHDGNRRMTCLKLILGKAPSGIETNLHAKIKPIIDSDYQKIDSKIFCRVEDDIETINRIMELQHIPGQSGAGQVNWDNHQKENFYKRTEQLNKMTYSAKINDALIKHGYFSEGEKINLSTFERLFTNPESRLRVGFRVNDNNQIEITKDLDKVFKALAHIARDKKTLGQLWNNKGKKDYLDKLERDGIISPGVSLLKEPYLIEDDGEIRQLSASHQTTAKKGTGHRKPFLTYDFPEPMASKFLSQKFCQIFKELNHKLSPNTHPVTLGNAFRSVLEMAVTSYALKHQIYAGLNEKKIKGLKLKEKIKAVKNHLENNKELSPDTLSTIEKFMQKDNLESLDSLNQNVHNDFWLPGHVLKAMGNNFTEFLRLIIEDLNESAE